MIICNHYRCRCGRAYGPLPALYTADLLPKYFQDGEACCQDGRGASRHHFMAIAHASRGTTTRVNDGVAACARPGLKQQPCCPIANFHFTSTAQSGFAQSGTGRGAKSNASVEALFRNHALSYICHSFTLDHAGDCGTTFLSKCYKFDGIILITYTDKILQDDSFALGYSH
jgi:hypothetical protein